MSRYIGPNPHRTTDPYAEKNPFINPPEDPYHTGLSRQWDIEEDRTPASVAERARQNAHIRYNSGVSAYGGEKHTLYCSDQNQDRRHLEQAPATASFDPNFSNIDLSISIGADPRMDIDKAYSLPLWRSQDYFDHRKNPHFESKNKNAQT